MIKRYWPVLGAIAAILVSVLSGRMMTVTLPFAFAIIIVGIIDFYRQRR